MWFLRSWPAVALGLVVAISSFFVAREYLRPATWRRPGLTLAEPDGQPVAPEGAARVLGLFALTLAGAGALLALIAGLLLLRRA